MKTVFTILILALVAAFAMLFYTKAPTETTSLRTPVGNKETPSSPTPKHLVGFLPYWQIGTLDSLAFPQLDEIIYFSLSATEEGDIVKIGEPGYTRFANGIVQTLQQKNPQAIISVAIVLHDNDKVEKFLASASAQQQLITNMLTFIETQRVGGINIDFEYSGVPGKETIAGYTNFVGNANNQIKKAHPKTKISVDATADAVKKSRLYDIVGLAAGVDYVVLMGYDFYRPNSSIAGPIAPLVGKQLWEYDITTAVSDYKTHIPQEKIVLGVPYYGWDFPTVDEALGSSVEDRPNESVALSTYKRTKQIIEQEQVTMLLDQDSQSPWFTYKDPDSGKTRQIWFEDKTSLGKKYDLVNQQNLGGIAIWALGYEGTHTDLSNLLKEKFRE